MDYEKKIKDLKELISKLENENLPLEQALKYYAEAEEIFKECANYLESAKGGFYKIKQSIEKYYEEKVE